MRNRVRSLRVYFANKANGGAACPICGVFGNLCEPLENRKKFTRPICTNCVMAFLRTFKNPPEGLSSDEACDHIARQFLLWVCKIIQRLPHWMNIKKEETCASS